MLSLCRYDFMLFGLLTKVESLPLILSENVWFLPYRVVHEGKEHRRRWAQKLTLLLSRDKESIEDVKEVEAKQESHDNKGMLPDEIVKLLADHEKYVILLSFCLIVDFTLVSFLVIQSLTGNTSLYLQESFLLRLWRRKTKEKAHLNEEKNKKDKGMVLSYLP